MATTKKLMGTTAAAGGAGFTAIEDVFSTYLYTGNGTSQTITNGIFLGPEVEYYGGGAALDKVNDFASISPISLGSGDFTIELWAYPTDLTYPSGQTVVASQYLGSPAGRWGIDFAASQKWRFFVNGLSSYVFLEGGPILSVNTWYHLAVTRSGSTFTFYVNGKSVGSGTATGSMPANTVPMALGCLNSSSSGQHFFGGKITDFRAVNNLVYSSNFTPPTEPLTDITGTLALVFQGATPFVDVSGNTTVTAVNGISASTSGPYQTVIEEGAGGLVWIKDRETTGSWHTLQDTERGTSSYLASNEVNEYTVNNFITSFNSNGFSVSNAGGVNLANTNFASWTFRKAPRFFDVVEFTYTGAGQISHNLGCKIGAIIMKRTDAAQDWLGWYYRGASAGSGYYLSLNTTAGNAGGRIDTEHTDTYFNPAYVRGSNSDGTVSPVSGGTYVAYLFAHDPLGPSGDGSDGLIACGSFTTDGSGNVTVDLGWEPQWILWKRSDGVENWVCVDNMRGWSTTSYEGLRPNISDAQFTNSNANACFPTATGFASTVGTAFSASASYIYIAIRRGPMRQPTSATDVFGIDTLGSTGDGKEPGHRSGFPVDFALVNNVSATSDTYALSRLMQGYRLETNNTDAQVSYSLAQFDYMNGSFASTSTLSSSYCWMWRRAPNYFDVVTYTGDGTAGRTVSHNLGVAPEMMIVKPRSGFVRGWTVYLGPLSTSTNDVYAMLNETSAAVDAPVFNDTAPTDTVFTVSADAQVNNGTSTYIAYLFATLRGVSKVGSYTGNGSSQTIDCGFTSGARFVLIKRTDSTGDWYVWDTERGIVAANDPHLSLNTTAAEVTTDDSVDPDNSGFIVNQVGATNINVNAASYIFYAIA